MAHVCGWLGHLLLPVAVAVPFVLLAVVVTVAPSRYEAGGYGGVFDHCNADGTFTPDDAPTFSLWDRSGLFVITLAWGHMTFSQAKVADVVWDIGVGRGGQALLLYLSFHVFSKTLARSMEEHGVSYGTFESMAFTSPTWTSPWVLVRDFATNRRARAKLAAAWVILASLFVLAFPTLNDAMSGYNTNVSAFMEDRRGVLLPWSDYRQVWFTIHDGERLGLQNPTYVAGTADDMAECATVGPSPDDDDYEGGHSAEEVGELYWDDVPASCTLFWHTVECRA